MRRCDTCYEPTTAGLYSMGPAGYWCSTECVAAAHDDAGAPRPMVADTAWLRGAAKTLAEKGDESGRAVLAMIERDAAPEGV